MMWMSSKPNEATWEPAELRDLKLKLAKLSCKCLNDRPKLVIRAINHIHDAHTPNDKEVQVGNLEHNSIDRFSQVNKSVTTKERRDFMYDLTKDTICPGCFVSMNLLRSGPFKVLKDEESETKPEMFSTDKWTEKRVKAVERTTSITAKPVVKYSNLTLCDFISERSSDLSIKKNDLKRNHQVKFVDDPINMPNQDTSTNETCFCLENFIDTIRPPLLDAYYFYK